MIFNWRRLSKILWAVTWIMEITSEKACNALLTRRCWNFMSPRLLRQNFVVLSHSLRDCSLFTTTKNGNKYSQDTVTIQFVNHTVVLDWWIFLVWLACMSDMPGILQDFLATVVIQAMRGKGWAEPVRPCKAKRNSALKSNKSVQRATWQVTSTS